MGFREIKAGDPKFEGYAQYFIRKKEAADKVYGAENVTTYRLLSAKKQGGDSSFALVYPLALAMQGVADIYKKRGTGSGAVVEGLLASGGCYDSPMLPPQYSKWRTCTLPDIRDNGLYVMQFASKLGSESTFSDGPIGKMTFPFSQFLMKGKPPHFLTGAHYMAVAISDVTGDGIDDVAIFMPEALYPNGQEKVDVNLRIFAGTTVNEHHNPKEVNMLALGVRTFKMAPSPTIDIAVPPNLYPMLKEASAPAWPPPFQLDAPDQTNEDQ